MKNKKTTKIIFGLFIATIACFGFSKTAHAYSAIEQKALGYGLYQCYNASGVMTPEIELANLKNYKSLVSDSQNDRIKILPARVASDSGLSGVVSCDTLMKKLLSNANINNAPVGDSNKINFLNKLGYESAVDNSKEDCFSFNLVYYDNNGKLTSSSTPKIYTTPQICSADGTMNSITVGDAGSGVMFNHNKEAGTLQMVSQVGGVSVLGTYDLNSGDFAGLKNAVRSDIEEYFGGDGVSRGDTKITLSLTNPINEGAKSTVEKYKLSGKISAPMITTNNLLGSSFTTSSISGLKFTADEMYKLYLDYLINTFGINGRDSTGLNGTICDYSESDEPTYIGAGYRKIPYYSGGSVKKCYIKATRNAENTVAGLNDSMFFDGTPRSWTDLLAAIAANESSLTNAGIGAAAQSNNASDGSDGAYTDNNNNNNSSNNTDDDGAGCLKSGVAGSLGWILCPVLNLLKGLAEDIYVNTVQPSLEIKPELFTSTEGGTKQGWDIFQGIANIFLVVLFLVVIFSQLTGVGIDNYGIKRILPKIILVAVLMNVSFYLCELAIDVSNIAGVGIQDIFKNLPTGAASTINVPGAFQQAGATVLASVAVAAGGWAVISAAGGGLVAFLTILPSILSVVVAIFFLFIILAARQAAIVILVVISPLAFVCYMLPNTKRWFDRWIKTMEALLLVFPICSLLVFGGDYVSRLLLSSGMGNQGVVSALTAMLVGIAPIFFIPSVLKKSLGGLGDLGNKISNMGGRLGNRAAGGLRNSDLYQSALGSAKERRNMQLSGKRWNADTSKWENDPSRLGRIRRSIYNSGIGRAAGWDRLEGRRSQRAEVDRSTADTERQNANLDIMNTQAEKNMETYDNRQGEAAGYTENDSNLTAEERRDKREARLVKARDDAMDRLSTGQGTAAAHLERNRRLTDTERRAAIATRQAGAVELARQTTADRLAEQEGQGLEALQARAIEANGGDIRSVTGTAADARDRARLARLQRQGKVDAGVEQTNLGYETQMAANRRTMEQNKINVGAPVVSDRYARRTAENALTNEQAKIDNVAPRVTREYANQMASNAAMSEAAKIAAGVPKLRWGTVSTMAGNEVRMTNAQQEVGVAEINDNLAKARAVASFKAQELRNSSDMYNTFVPSELLSEAGFQLDAKGNITRDASTGRPIIDTNKLKDMLGQKGGAQRFVALAQTMTSKGLENSMFDVMMNQDVASILASNQENDTDVRAAFASSPEKVAKAWGKTGAGMSMYDFVNKMQTYTDEKGNAVQMTALQKYMGGKGAQEFFTNISDKSLGVIEAAQKNADFDIIKTSDMMQGLEIVKEQSAVSSMVNMIKNRGDLTMSGEQLTKVAPSVISELATTEQGQKALIEASDDIVGDRDRMNKIHKSEREIIDNLRKEAGLEPIWEQSSNGNPAPSGGPTGGPSGGGPAPAPDSGPVPTGGPAPAPSGSDDRGSGGNNDDWYYKAFGGGTDTSGSPDAAPTPDTTSGPVPAPESQQTAQPRRQPSPSAAEIARERTGLKTRTAGEILTNAINGGTGVFLEAAAEELASRSRVPLTKDDLSSMTNDVVLRKMLESGNPNHAKSIIEASKELEKDPAAVRALPADVRYAIDEARLQIGMQGIRE